MSDISIDAQIKAIEQLIEQAKRAPGVGKSAGDFIFDDDLLWVDPKNYTVIRRDVLIRIFEDTLEELRYEFKRLDL